MLGIFKMQIALTLIFALFSLAVNGSPTPQPDQGIGFKVSNVDATNVIANQYIVVYKKNASDTAITAQQEGLVLKMRKRNLEARGTGAPEMKGVVSQVSMSGWRCMAVQADDSTMLEIQNSGMVSYIEADTIVKASGPLDQEVAPLGLKRISHAAASTVGYVFDDSAGEGITAFVVDTGIRTTHSEFGGRATFGINTVNQNDTDENGHGSHVSGTIGGTTFGVAKKVNIVGVKVLDGDGAGSNSGVIAGLQFVSQNAVKGKSVMNMSLGGPVSTALNQAVEALSRAGVTSVVAAGNEAQDTANTSPGSATSAITVGAIDASTDQIASFSNFGTGVDIFAPGVKVQSVGITSDTSTNTLSGTSMASPHVAGLAAYIMAAEGIQDPAQVRARMFELAGSTGAAVKGGPAGTTKLIAYNGSGL